MVVASSQYRRRVTASSEQCGSIIVDVSSAINTVAASPQHRQNDAQQ
jgi:hypothetical protein